MRRVVVARAVTGRAVEHVSLTAGAREPRFGTNARRPLVPVHPAAAETLSGTGASRHASRTTATGTDKEIRVEILASAMVHLPASAVLPSVRSARRGKKPSTTQKPWATQKLWANEGRCNNCYDASRVRGGMNLQSAPLSCLITLKILPDFADYCGAKTTAFPRSSHIVAQSGACFCPNLLSGKPHEKNTLCCGQHPCAEPVGSRQCG